MKLSFLRQKIKKSFLDTIQGIRMELKGGDNEYHGSDNWVDDKSETDIGGKGSCGSVESGGENRRDNLKKIDNFAFKNKT